MVWTRYGNFHFWLSFTSFYQNHVILLSAGLAKLRLVDKNSLAPVVKWKLVFIIAVAYRGHDQYGNLNYLAQPYKFEFIFISFVIQLNYHKNALFDSVKIVKFVTIFHFLKKSFNLLKKILKIIDVKVTNLNMNSSKT